MLIKISYLDKVYCALNNLRIHMYQIKIKFDKTNPSRFAEFFLFFKRLMTVTWRFYGQINPSHKTARPVTEWLHVNGSGILDS